MHGAFGGDLYVQKDCFLAYIVNSSPGAGLRFEPSATFEQAQAALGHASGLASRGMRLIRIRDTKTGEVFDKSALRRKILSEAGALAMQSDDTERAALTAEDYRAAGVEAPNWTGEPIPALETWRRWKQAEDHTLSHKRIALRATLGKAPG